ncbi:carbonic anhydrase [Mycobacterium yunnanensis]|uniref:carbonic anhydrase n=1 Tax=Mycobacterium yunnanensis TaxID=368477 RepID=A0A9X2YNQ2_9MYCO|nr:carbonic anhydrase [Mycobacterium yunnanensis]MCV7422757.1 carbonic anhydrase [Mycobacterium yunnanensis]
MSHFTTLLERNRAFADGGREARNGFPTLPFIPHQTSFVITCVDPRTDPAAFLGIELGDAIVLRNVGGRVTDAVIQDVAYIGYLVDRIAPQGPYFEVAIIHHDDCGSTLLADDALRAGFAERSGYDEEMLSRLPVLDPERTVRHDVDLLLSDGRMSAGITVSGHVYDVHTGLLTTVVEAQSPSARARSV